MSPDGRLYDLALRAAPPLLRLGAPFSAKLRRGLDGRRDALSAVEQWGVAHRDADRPLYWLHAPSVGEALMAQAIIAALRAGRPDAQVAFTFFSPSAERVAARVGADVAVYLPWDSDANASALFAALRPAAIGFVRTEIWPGIVRAADEAGVPTALLNAVLAAGSSRLRAPGRQLLTSAYQRLAAVGAVSIEDGHNFPRLGVPAARVRVTGDARFDQVHARVRAIDRAAPMLASLDDGMPTIVAGSTWPADEARLVPALGALLDGHSFRLILAPHEPTPAHLAGAERRLRDAGFTPVRLADWSPGGARREAIVVDRVGVLADLYAIAAAAYVGGGFGTAGLHSVVEPAALGVPVVFGPALGNAREAAALAEAGGGVVAAGGVRRAATAAIAAAFERWLGDEGGRAAAAAAAARFVDARRGGAVRNAQLLLQLP